MYQNKLLIDVTTLTTFLQENGLLSKIGGVKVLIELINQIPNLVYLEEYIRLIKDKFLRRSLIRLGYKTINSSYVTNLPLESILNEFAENPVNDVVPLGFKNKNSEPNLTATFWEDSVHPLSGPIIEE